MEIHESKIFKFVFPFMGESNVIFNIYANTQQDAAVMLKVWMNKAQTELAMQFPEVQPMQQASIPVEFNSMQIMLLDDLVKAIDSNESRPLNVAVKELTGLEMTLDNVKLIIPKLEALKDNPPLPQPKNDGKKSK